MNKFDRIGDWKVFSKHMEEYLEGPQTKYGSSLKFNDLCHYTGLRVSVWNILKYALRLWNCCGKKNDLEKTAHYSQMAWTLKERQGRGAPYFKEDVEGDYVVLDETDKTPGFPVIKEQEMDAEIYESSIDKMYRILGFVSDILDLVNEVVADKGENFIGKGVRENAYKINDRIIKVIKTKDGVIRTIKKGEKL